MRGNTQLCPKIEISLENEAKWRLIAEYLQQKVRFSEWWAFQIRTKSSWWRCDPLVHPFPRSGIGNGTHCWESLSRSSYKLNYKWLT